MIISPVPYLFQAGVVSRSISFENPTGDVGNGARAESPLGTGRKGSAVRHLHDGETIQLADIKGNGTIRHIWLTMHRKPNMLRGTVLRFYWDGQEHPSIEMPVGDFFGFANGQATAFQSIAHSVSSTKGMNIWLPMPFVTGAKVEITNLSGERIPLFFQIDFTLGDGHPDNVGRLHGCFNRANPTTPRSDFEILPVREGRIRFLGTVLGVNPKSPLWWGEGEMKAFIDGDDAFPTIAGTGSEDYVGQAWGIQNEAFLHHGCNWREKEDDADTGRVSIYRWHLADPILCESRMRIAIQQIGHNPTGNARSIDDYKAELFERADDWSAAAFWYQQTPSTPLPPCPDAAVLVADLG